ncbi:hypothetical protein [Ornithinicoccus halotolerans]|uniref:hypothetical protein n=1 Tax=Ornithinicoccus halotolerans TaxID=1748220 RepID=UPI001296BC88|nr:hypothetical protein [Ornithinicoccus halotolerans]
MSRQQEQGTDRDPEPLLFLVELRAAIGVPTDLNAMRGSLYAAITKLQYGGVDIGQADAFLLPGDARCLCLVQSSDQASVALACDAAGLTAAPVHEVHRLPAPSRAFRDPQAEQPTVPAAVVGIAPETP